MCCTYVTHILCVKYLHTNYLCVKYEHTNCVAICGRTFSKKIGAKFAQQIWGPKKWTSFWKKFQNEKGPQKREFYYGKIPKRIPNRTKCDFPLPPLTEALKKGRNRRAQTIGWWRWFSTICLRKSTKRPSAVWWGPRIQGKTQFRAQKARWFEQFIKIGERSEFIHWTNLAWWSAKITETAIKKRKTQAKREKRGKMQGIFAVWCKINANQCKNPTSCKWFRS